MLTTILESIANTMPWNDESGTVHDLYDIGVEHYVFKTILSVLYNLNSYSLSQPPIKRLKENITG